MKRDRTLNYLRSRLAMLDLEGDSLLTRRVTATIYLSLFRCLLHYLVYDSLLIAFLSMILCTSSHFKLDSNDYETSQNHVTDEVRIFPG